MTPLQQIAQILVDDLDWSMDTVDAIADVLMREGLIARIELDRRGCL